MAVNIDAIAETYFWFDLPVPYKLRNGDVININPVMVKNSSLFRHSTPVIMTDKNTISDPKIIQMSYLQFVTDYLIKNNDIFRLFLGNILFLCLDMKSPIILRDELNRPFILDEEKGTIITNKDFDDIKRIILYQNMPSYDDEYVSPELKQMMDRVDNIKRGNIVEPSLERKFGIIEAHCGRSKESQMKMTMRSHSILFNECAGEIEFTTTRPVSLISSSKNKLEHWIFKESKSKYDGYMVSINQFAKSFGGDASMINSSTILSSDMNTLLNNISKQ